MVPLDFWDWDLASTINQFYVGQDEVVELVAGAMEQRPEAPGFLLDGFPANMTQAKLAKERMGEPVKVIVLEIPDPVMMSRYFIHRYKKMFA